MRTGGLRPSRFSSHPCDHLPITGLSARAVEAIDVFLSQGERPDGGRSTLSAAIGEAHAAMYDSGTFWLGSLGYLVVMETIGSTVAKPSSHFRRTNATETFMTGAREFAPHPMTRKHARAFYALRSALAHRYSLRHYHGGSNHYRFVLDRTGPLIRFPSRPWNGTTRPDPANDMTQRKRFATSVNVLRLAEYVEELMTNLRAEHALGHVRLCQGLDPEDVIAFGQFYVD